MGADYRDERFERELTPIPAQKSAQELGADAKPARRERPVAAVMALDKPVDTRRHFSR
jgi:hypothetical protein